jgi:hypothetical protein
MKESSAKCIYLSLLGDDARDQLLGIGIDISTMSKIQDSQVDTERLVVIILDDAQRQYGNLDFWNKFVKTNNVFNLPKNIHFIVSATYSLNTIGSPIDFASFPRLTVADFVLNDTEVEVYLDLSAENNKSNVVGTLLKSEVFRTVISVTCGNHIGALSVSVNGIYLQFSRDSATTVDVAMQFYISKDFIPNFHRCYASGVTEIPGDGLRALLLRCLRDQSAVYNDGSISSAKDKDIYNQLIRAGVLVPTESLKVKFSSPAASQFINWMIFPNRSMDQPASVFWLVEEAIKEMSGTALLNSLADRVNGFPSETTFQHFILEGLHRHTLANSCIYSELSTMIPFSQEDKKFARIPGRCDFFINGDVRWLVELLVNGNTIGEHASRMIDGGKYAGLKITDYAVVDFRGSISGTVTGVGRDKNRMTVFFKLGDYSQCTLQSGLHEEPRLIKLKK